MTKRWLNISQFFVEETPPIIHGPAVTSFGSKIIVLGGKKEESLGRTYSFDVWRLEVVANDTAKWRLMPKPPLAPRESRKGIVTDLALNGEIIVAFSGVNSDITRGDTELWMLNVTTMRWSLYFPFTRPVPVGVKGVVLAEKILVIFGGCQFSSPLPIRTKMFSTTCHNLTFMYIVDAQEWVNVAFNRKNMTPVGRIHHSLVKKDKWTMVLFGGLTYKKGYKLVDLADLWTFDLYDGWTALSSQSSVQLPLHVFAHAATVVGSSLFVYGGLVKVSKVSLLYTNACNSTFWKYNFTSNIWEIVTTASTRTPGGRCFHSLRTYGRHIILTPGCSTVYHRVGMDVVNGEWYPLKRSIECVSSKSDYSVWAFKIDNTKWTRLASQRQYEYQLSHPSIIMRKNYLIALGGWIVSNTNHEYNWIMFTEYISPHTGFAIMKLACPQGYFSDNFPISPCLPCSIGTYSNSFLSQNCTACPLGLTTVNESSTQKSHCNVCLNGYCEYGSCKVILPGPETFCECNFGFTRNDKGQCTIATYYIAGSSAIAGIIFLVLMIALAVKFFSTQKKHRQNIQYKDQVLDDMTNAWIVDSRELLLHERIDGDSPGGFGEVYRAEYREMTVAVKRLQQLQRIERLELEFEREIEVMRSIRHPNIVLFLGGGKFHDDDCPFLVVEYMPRGSLSSILKEIEIKIENTMKLSFALDVAKGMRFLHSLSPPRIHRDLKSGNCLVSNRYIVKVADFGSARLVKIEGKRQRAVRGCGPLSLTQPLLEPEYELTTAIGTRQWTAPEVFQGVGYGTPVDVYSFGIVLWEIWSRKVPYEDEGPISIIDFKDFIVDGMRPSVNDMWPEEQTSLMKQCWVAEPADRPTFSEVVDTLEVEACS